MGTASVTVTFVAAFGPLLWTAIVYWSCSPAVAGDGDAVFVMETSAWDALTVVWAESLLFDVLGSGVVALTVAVFVITVPAFTLGSIFTVRVRVSPSPAARDPFLHTTVPEWSTAGVVQLHPDGMAMDWNVVFGGRVSSTSMPLAVLGPLFFTLSL